MPKNTIGKLVSTFRFHRQKARDNAADRLYKRNKLENPKSRDGYEIRETEITDSQGNTLITSQLWHKVDEERVKVSVNVSANTVDTEEDIEDLFGE